MKCSEIREALEKQLNRLSECSEKSKDDPEMLCHLTAQMVALCGLMLLP